MRESYCKESEQISEYLEGHLDGEKIREIAAHLKSCSTCAATLRDLQSLKSLLNNAETPSVPPNKEFWANAYRNARLSVREMGFFAEPTGCIVDSCCGFVPANLYFCC
jgi:anti-sigma factor RsiW